MYASRTRARAVNLRLAFSTTQKGTRTCVEYFAKMKSLGDEMVATGKPLDDEELVEYIITRLGEEYSSLASALYVRGSPSLFENSIRMVAPRL